MKNQSKVYGLSSNIPAPLVLAARLGLAYVFLRAAAPKIMDPVGFAGDIENYAMVPKVLINFMAVTLPWVELSAALALLLGALADLFPRSALGRFQLARPAALLCIVLLAVFIIAIASAVYRNLDISCGCFGHSGGRKAGLSALAEDGGFLLLALLSILPARVPE